MLVITAERLPHDPGTVLSEAPWSCESPIVFGAKPGMKHWKPDPVHLVATDELEELKAHV